MIAMMRSLLDFPLMVLAVLQRCAEGSENSTLWLNLENQIRAIVDRPIPLSFRKTWFEHAMQASGSKKRSGASCPRKWAGLLVEDKEEWSRNLDAKAIEVSNWLKGKKQPSVENIRRIWRAIARKRKLTQKHVAVGQDWWLLSWMVTLWLEKHFADVAAEFKSESQKIGNYYRRFFDYLEMARNDNDRKGAGGLLARQP